MQSFANIINISVSDSEVEVGETLTVTLEGSSFEAFDTFSFDFLFDESLFVFAGSEASDLPNDGSNTFLEFGTALPGLVGVGYFDYATTFTGDFFVSFDLEVLAPGASSFSIDNQTTDFESFVDGNVLTVDDALSVKVQASAVSVSEPDAVVLLTAAFAMFAGFRRKA
jgi:hypothetical protein